MSWGLALLGLGVGMGLAVVGGGLGIGRLAASALEGSARQPEMMGALRNLAILLLAFIEAFVFLVIILAFVLSFMAMKKAEGGREETAPAPATSTNK
jgi:F-type H+-transporting ATPase subunit c